MQKNLGTIAERPPHILFEAMAICPEDVPVPPEVLEFVWCSATAATMPLSSIVKMQVGAWWRGGAGTRAVGARRRSESLAVLTVVEVQGSTVLGCVTSVGLG